jgi:hypothetical protein
MVKQTETSLPAFSGQLIEIVNQVSVVFSRVNLPIDYLKVQKITLLRENVYRLYQ